LAYPVRLSLKLATLAAAALLASACTTSREMTFRTLKLSAGGVDCKLVSCPSVVVADGEFRSTTPEDFIAFMKTEVKPGVKNVVLISSPGGELYGSLTMGLIWRELGTTVIVGKPGEEAGGTTSAFRTAICASGCAYAIMAARERLIVANSRIGVHRVHLRPADRSGPDQILEIPAGSNTVDFLKTYMRRVGVDPKVIDLAEKTAPTDIHLLTDRELKRFRIAVKPLAN
jgi:hypothetical protein